MIRLKCAGSKLKLSVSSPLAISRGENMYRHSCNCVANIHHIQQPIGRFDTGFLVTVWDRRRLRPLPPIHKPETEEKYSGVPDFATSRCSRVSKNRLRNFVSSDGVVNSCVSKLTQLV